MIDVMMFLLVFFVLISTNVLPALGLKVALPRSSNPDHLTEPRRVTITISKDARLFLDADPVELSQLSGKLDGMQGNGVKLAVIIASDQGAQVQALVGVMDALKSAKVQAASIISKKQ